MFSGRYDMGDGWGRTLVCIVSVEATITGSGDKQKSRQLVLKPTHAYILHIDHVVSKMYIYFFFSRRTLASNALSGHPLREQIFTFRVFIFANVSFLS